jgi:hypothetical protein
MIEGITDLCDVRFHHPGLASAWAREGPCLHRLEDANRRPIPLATAPEVRRVDGVGEARHGPWPAPVFHGGEAQRTRCALPCGHRVSSAACGAVPLRLQALHEAVAVLVQGLLIGLGPHLIHPGGGLRPDVAPARFQDVLVAHPVEVADPIALVPFCRQRSALQGGWPWGPLLPVRARCPLQAPSAWPPRPRVSGAPVSASDARL